MAIYHYQPYFNHWEFFDWGWINVDLFFLISGLVMTHVYEKRIEAGAISFPQFLSHRIARLWPVHVFALLLMLELEVVLHGFLGQPHIVDWNAPVYTLLLNLVFLQNIGLYNASTWDGNGWSLTPEIVANLVWFYLVVKRRLSSKLLLTVVLLFAVLQYNFGGGINGTILNSYLIRCFISYGLGCLLYRHFIANRQLAPLPRVWCDVVGFALVGLILLIIVNVNLLHRALLHDWDWMMVLFVFPVLTYVALQPRTILNVILSSPPLVFLGTISYSVYLLHVPVATVITSICTAWRVQYFPPFQGAIYLVITILLSVLTWRFVEVPSRRALRDRLAPFLASIFFDRY